MAEEKKSTKPTKSTKLTKPAEGIKDKKAGEELVFLLAGLFLLSAVVTGLFNYIEGLELGASDSLWNRVLDYFLLNVWPIWKLIAAMLSVLTLIGIVYNSWKLRAISLEEQKIYGTSPEASILNEGKIVEPKNKKWEKIIEYANSTNVSDWRLAIIEADVMLEEVLRAAGYLGESVGEMLKSVDKNEFLTIEDAWEAHKARNAIAHSGGDFQLNEHETKRVLALFEKVFKEFGVI